MKHTVHSDGDGLGESEAIGTLESRDLAEGAELLVLSRLVEGSSRVGLSLNQLELQVIALGSDEGGDGTTVLLFESLRLASCPK